MMAKKFEIELVNFFIFNPLLSPKEGEEHKKLIYFHPSSQTIDSKMKVVGFSEAIINFLKTFSTSDTESMYTQETKQFYFKPESDFWMVLTVSVPRIEQVAEKNTKKKKGTHHDYREDLISDSTYQAVLKRIYHMFKLFNGSFEQILCHHTIDDLKVRVEHFCNKYLPTIHFNHSDIMDVFEGLFYLPLDQHSYFKIQSFIQKFECMFPEIQSSMLLYNSQLVWSGLELPETKLIFHFLLSSVYPAIFEKSFIARRSASQHSNNLNSTASSSKKKSIQNVKISSTSNAHTPSNASQYSANDRSSNPNFQTSNNTSSSSLASSYSSTEDAKIGGFTLGPPDLTNPSNLGQIPVVHLPSSPTHPSAISPSTAPSKLCRLLVYKLFDALVCIFVQGSEDPSFDLMMRVDVHLSSHLTPLVSLLSSTITKNSPEQSYKYVYNNRVNGAQKTTLHNSHRTALNVPTQFLDTISSVHQDLNCNIERDEEACETVVKLATGGWVVGRKAENRELYVVLEQKDANLGTVSDEVKKMCSTNFPNLFFTD